MARGGSGILAGAIALAGCGGGGPEAGPPPPPFEPALYGALSALSVASDLPVGGSASYAGGFVADIRQGDVTPSGRIEGAVTLELDFAAGGATLPLSGALHGIDGAFLGRPVRIDRLPLRPGGGALVLSEAGGARQGRIEAGFGGAVDLGGTERHLDIGLSSALRGPGGRAMAGPVSGTVLTAPFTDQPHVLTGRFHASAE